MRASSSSLDRSYLAGEATAAVGEGAVIAPDVVIQQAYAQAAAEIVDEVGKSMAGQTGVRRFSATANRELRNRTYAERADQHMRAVDQVRSA